MGAVRSSINRCQLIISIRQCELFEVWSTELHLYRVIFASYLQVRDRKIDFPIAVVNGMAADIGLVRCVAIIKFGPWYLAIVRIGIIPPNGRAEQHLLNASSWNTVLVVLLKHIFLQLSLSNLWETQFDLAFAFSSNHVGKMDSAAECTPRWDLEQSKSFASLPRCEKTVDLLSAY